jgi:hypothetical protein
LKVELNRKTEKIKEISNENQVILKRLKETTEELQRYKIRDQSKSPTARVISSSSIYL